MLNNEEARRGALRELVEAAIGVASREAEREREEQDRLDEVRLALEGGDQQAAVTLMCRYFGIPTMRIAA